MPKYRKKDIKVNAQVADTQQYVTTLEGVSEAKPGDYIVTGVDNEQWVVKPQWFKQAYTHVHGNTYRRIPHVLTATQIQEPEVVSAPTGPIKGDKGDYKVTGTKGEQWFVKPDIFAKTYEPVKGGDSMNKSLLDMVISQIGEPNRYLPKGMKINRCDLHGSYLQHYKQEANCPVCQAMIPDPNNNQGNGTTPTQIEHYIDLRDGINPYTDHDMF